MDVGGAYEPLLSDMDEGDACDPSCVGTDTEGLRGVCAEDVVAVVGRGVSKAESVDEAVPDSLFVAVALGFALLSAGFRLRRDDCSFSALSMTTFAILTNSEQIPSMR